MTNGKRKLTAKGSGRTNRRWRRTGQERKLPSKWDARACLSETIIRAQICKVKVWAHVGPHVSSVWLWAGTKVSPCWCRSHPCWLWLPETCKGVEIYSWTLLEKKTQQRVEKRGLLGSSTTKKPRGEKAGGTGAPPAAEKGGQRKREF